MTIVVELSDKSIKRIVEALATVMGHPMNRAGSEDEPDDGPLPHDLLSTKEAAALLGISPSRVRAIKDRLPHVKVGDDKRGRLLFRRDGLLEAYLGAAAEPRHTENG